jgi:hypothetical protein
MSKNKDLKKEQSNTLPALPDDVADELAAFAATANRNLNRFLGTLLTYKKEIGAPEGGCYRHGEKKVELPLGTRLIGFMGEIRHGHRMWRGGRIVGEAIYKVVDVPYLNRNDLGDFDEDAWPISELTGKREDPWLHYVYLPLVTLDGKKFYTFCAKSFYGRSAAYSLMDRYAALGRQHIGQYPIVELGSKIIPSKKFGEIPAPVFTIVGWTSKPTLALADERESTAADDNTTTEDAAPDNEDPSAGMDEVLFDDIDQGEFGKAKKAK